MLPLSAERWLGFGLRRIVRGIAVSAYLGRVRLSHTAGEACWQLVRLVVPQVLRQRRKRNLMIAATYRMPDIGWRVL